MKYIRKLINYLDHIIVTLKVSILTIFISLFTIATIMMISINYHSASNDIIFIANKSMKDIIQSLDKLFMNEMTLADRDSSISIALIQQKVLDTNNIDKLINYFYYLAQQFTFVQAIYWGDVNGSFVSAEYDDDDTISSEYFTVNNLPKSDTIIRRDIKGNVKEILKETDTFDPRLRPWYIQAVSKHETTWTNVYRYEPSGYLGITLATPIYGSDAKLKGVLGMDIRLDWISWYLNTVKTTPNGIIFVVQKDGKLISYPQFDKLPKLAHLVDIHSIPAKWISESFNLYKKNKLNSFRFSYNSKNYLASFQPMPMLKNQGWLIGLVIPSSDFTGDLNNTRKMNILIGLIILLAGIVVISKLVNSIVNPVKSLIIETNKIKNFDLEGDRRIRSRIKEVILLSDAIYMMKLGLRSFKHYVPSALVRQLIRMGVNVRLGGTKKKLVVFFSDIKDFTAIAHEATPDQMVMQLNEYFEELTRILIHERSTVDKYIGDAIMAFWGAPDETEYPCQHAAEAALQCQEKLKILNEKWVSEGKPAFYTRIGIHYGYAIVGNVGSSERINYTAIGDSINIANRLEGINKELNTSITVSEAVYEQIKDQFNLRKTGIVTLKGIAEKMSVYELLGRK